MANDRPGSAPDSNITLASVTATSTPGRFDRLHREQPYTDEVGGEALGGVLGPVADAVSPGAAVAAPDEQAPDPAAHEERTEPDGREVERGDDRLPAPDGRPVRRRPARPRAWWKNVSDSSPVTTFVAMASTKKVPTATRPSARGRHRHAAMGRQPPGQRDADARARRSRTRGTRGAPGHRRGRAGTSWSAAAPHAAALSSTSSFVGWLPMFVSTAASGVTSTSLQSLVPTFVAVLSTDGVPLVGVPVLGLVGQAVGDRRPPAPVDPAALTDRVAELVRALPSVIGCSPFHAEAALQLVTAAMYLAMLRSHARARSWACSTSAALTLARPAPR